MARFLLYSIRRGSGSPFPGLVRWNKPHWVRFWLSLAAPGPVVTHRAVFFTDAAIIDRRKNEALLWQCSLR